MSDDVSDENVPDENARPLRRAKPSMAPSWAMLGFVLGALFVLALPRPAPPAAPLLPPVPPPVAPPLTLARLSLVENVFAEWSDSAIWANDITEVAMWNGDNKSYSDFYEVMRSGGSFYFRSIPRLTRPVLTHDVKPNAPFQFTETQARRDEWLKERNQLTFRALAEAAQKNIPAPGAKPPVDPK